MTITPSDSLDLLIAHGPPDATDFAKQIAGLPGAYYAGLDEAYKRRQQDAFQNGVPTIDVIGPDGKPTKAPDYNAMAITAAKTGGIPGVAPFAALAGLDINRQQQAADVTSAQERAGVIPGAPPSTAPTAPPPSPPPRIPSDGTGQSVTGILSSSPFQGRAADAVQAAVKRQLGYDATQQLTPQQVSQVQQFVAQVPRPPQQTAQTPVQPSDNAPITRPPVAAAPVVDPNSPIPPYWQAQENGANSYLARLRLRSAAGTKEGREQTEKTIKAVEEWQAKNADIERGARTKEGEELSKTLTTLSNDGIEARGHTAQLEEIKRLGRNVGYGIIPKVQSVLGHYGIETKGLTDIQAYERAVDFFAPQLRPVGSGRLLQNELNSFKSALGGLMTTPQGRELSVNNLQILSKYKEDIGRIAADKSLTGDQRVNKIYSVQVPHLQTALGPKPGTVDPATGYKFKGGDPNLPASWTK